jgi:sugar phosphate isomerase/epimerase
MVSMKVKPVIACSGTIGISLELEAVLAVIAAKGFSSVDLLLVSGWAHVGLDTLAGSYAETIGFIGGLLAKYGLSIACANVKFSVPLEDRQLNAFGARQKEFDALLRFMQLFGVTHASIQPTLSSDEAYLQRTKAAVLEEVLRLQLLAEQESIVLSMEPHIHSAFCTHETLVPLLREHPRFQVTYDPSHLLYSGETLASTTYLMQHATLVHLRDACKQCLSVPYPQGELDVGFVAAGLSEFDYAGPVVLEVLSDHALHSDLAGLELLHAQTRKWFVEE